MASKWSGNGEPRLPTPGHKGYGKTRRKSNWGEESQSSVVTRPTTASSWLRDSGEMQSLCIFLNPSVKSEKATRLEKQPPPGTTVATEPGARCRSNSSGQSQTTKTNRTCMEGGGGCPGSWPTYIWGGEPQRRQQVVGRKRGGRSQNSSGKWGGFPHPQCIPGPHPQEEPGSGVKLEQDRDNRDGKRKSRQKWGKGQSRSCWHHVQEVRGALGSQSCFDQASC